MGHSSDFFNARAKSEREAKAAKLEADKKERIKARTAADKARVILEAHGGEPTNEKIKEFAKSELQDLCSWRVGTKGGIKNKNKLLELYLSVPPPKKVVPWSEEEEMKLQELKSDDIPFKDTALHVSLKQSAKAVKNNVKNLDEDEASELLQALQERSGTVPTGENQRGLI